MTENCTPNQALLKDDKYVKNSVKMVNPSIHIPSLNPFLQDFSVKFLVSL